MTGAASACHCHREAGVRALGLLCTISAPGSPSQLEELLLPLTLLHTAASLESGPVGVAALQALGDAVCLWWVHPPFSRASLQAREASRAMPLTCRGAARAPCCGFCHTARPCPALGELDGQ